MLNPYSQQWLLDRADLIRERHEDLAVLTAEEYQKISIFFANCMFSLYNFIEIILSS